MHSYATGRFIDEIDCLVRHESIGDIAGGQRRRRAQSFIADFETVVFFVEWSHACQNLEGFIDRRLFHLDGLEAALEGGIPLNVLAIFVQGRCANRLQLSTGERRLQDIGRIDCAFGCSRSDEGMQLVNEEDRTSFLDLGDNLFQPLFEFAAVFRAGNERTDIQCHQTLVLQCVRHVAVHNPLGEALDNGCFSDARLPDERRVIFGPSRQNLHHSVDLGLAARSADRICSSALLQSGRTQARPCMASWFGPSAGCCLAALSDHLQHLRANLFEIDSERLKHTGSDTFTFTDQAEKQVFGADVMMIESARPSSTASSSTFLARGVNPMSPTTVAFAATDDELHRGANFGKLDVHVASTLAATPSPSRTSPSKRCSVPM